jgi:20S proteasome alpha/beta subunit
MGTTIVGLCYDGGVVLGADSRTSTGTTRFRPICVCRRRRFAVTVDIN